MSFLPKGLDFTFHPKEKTVSGWIEENGPPFFPQILNREWLGHLPMKVKVPRKDQSADEREIQQFFHWRMGLRFANQNLNLSQKRGSVFLNPTTNCLFL